MKSEHDSFLAYYLTQDDQSAQNFKDTRSAVLPYEVPENQEVSLPLNPTRIVHHLSPGIFPGNRIPVRARLRDGQGRAGSTERVPAGVG